MIRDGRGGWLESARVSFRLRPRLAVQSIAVAVAVAIAIVGRDENDSTSDGITARASRARIGLIGRCSIRYEYATSSRLGRGSLEVGPTLILNRFNPNKLLVACRSRLSFTNRTMRRQGGTWLRLAPENLCTPARKIMRGG